jgi:acyl carrier protein
VQALPWKLFEKRVHMETIKKIVKEYILQEVLPGEDPANLGDDLELVRSGILDSLARLKLVAFLEERFGIHLEAHEATPANLGTITRMAALVQQKMQQ